MPCDSSYMNPNQAEADSKHTCQLLRYVFTELKRPVPDWVAKAAQEYYGNPIYLDEAVVLLCATISKMTQAQGDRIVYNARSKQSRELADWWEEHQAADRKREAREKTDRERQATKRRALAKLTPAERKALNL